MRFKDREDAGRQLARLLTRFENDNPLVLGLSRGGVPVAAEVAHALGGELDVWVVRKIGAPEQAEFALGAVAEGGGVALDRNAARRGGLTTPELNALTQTKFAEVDERVTKFHAGRPPARIEGRTVIVVDDGIATGRTMHAALEAVRRRRPERLVLAAPIADVRVRPEFSQLADELAVVQWTDHLLAIGLWYEDFEQTSDEEVIALLEGARARKAGEDSGELEGNQPREIDIDIDDVTLTGVLSIPLGATGLVIFAHGSGSSRFSPRNRFVASRLRTQGLGTLLFDLLTPLEELEDAQTAALRFDIDFLARRLAHVTRAIISEPDIEGLRLGYFGASTGAAAALVAAAHHPELIGAIVARGGRPDLAEAALPRVRAPTLLLVGERDLEVLELNLRALEDLRCEKELATISGATHLFEESGALEQVSERAGDWFERHLVPRRLHEVPGLGAWVMEPGDCEVRPILFAGTQSAGFGAALGRQLGAPLGRSTVQRFPDGELQAVVEEDVEGAEVVLIQSLQPPIGESLLELRLLADACLGAGARRLTAVVPYFAYARQDRRLDRGESLGGAVIARLVSEGFSRILTVDLHAEAAEGWFTTPLEHLSALPTLAQTVRPATDPRTVVVSPDLGGAKRAERFARALGLEFAIVHKSRRSGQDVAVHGILGQVRDRPILIVDDMISTGGTIEGAVKALRAAGCAPEITVVATHALLVGAAIERLAAARIQRLVHSDSVQAPGELPFAHQVVPLAPLLGVALRSRAPTR